MIKNKKTLSVFFIFYKFFLFRKNIFILFFYLFSCSTLAAVERPSQLLVGAGGFEMFRKKRVAELYLEYQPGQIWHTIRPILGVMVTIKKQSYIYTGLQFDWIFCNHFTLGPNFCIGWYGKGKGKNLGYPLEFRSGVAAGYRFSQNSRIGLQFYHLSNAGLGKINPGSESLLFFISIPLK